MQGGEQLKFRKIAITGGKGGTGKSTVSILLANKLRAQGKRVVLADCDVGCPNDYLLLGQKLKRPKEKVHARFPKLNERRCQKCGLCVKNCRSHAVFQAPERFPIFIHELCSGCGLCWHLCPYQAIRIEKRVIGEIFEGRVAESFYLVTGRSVGVVDEMGPIVTEVRDYALRLAKKVKADYLLSDTSVGMHCDVIRALIGSDLAYAVTEPTPLGAHDLELILKLLQKLKVSAKIILNQVNLGKKEEIDRISKEMRVKIEYEIYYSRELMKAYSKGELAKVNIL
jgi:MinD superfamily P-loop ATPase